MRSFLNLLTLLSLLVAPFAAPAAAIAQVRAAAADCQDMDKGAAKHSMPEDKHRASDPCCLAVPPAIDPPLSALEAAAPLGHLPFVVARQAFRLGAGPKAEDPPPRIS